MKNYRGAFTAIVTPFRDGEVDEQGFIDLIEFQIREGIDGLVPCGTTGESATLGFDEHKRVVEIAVKTVDGRVPVIAGTGANNTLEAIEFTESAKESGADAVLSVAPYYNKPNQQGIYEHFKAISEAVDIPIFLYNVPGRTVVNIEPATVARLAELNNIIGIKEACANLEQISDVIRFCPDDFIVFSGDDFTSMPTIFVGGRGVISVVSNLHPSGMAEMIDAALSANVATACQQHYKLFPLMKLMFRNPSPAPAKKALELMGKIKDGTPRLPLTPADEQTTELLRQTLTSLDML